ncbi:uncharacterized protein LOC129808578 [Phlebotomus papatasi]|uniref:uncharacterized protein LOC129808578 n=1 Tax=Phlebotomus papatasi TaxID=29031 RepID=UPI00248352BC|nr:uncharacterized protein LOC129808578 [Phlebotomus papatasi]
MQYTTLERSSRGTGSLTPGTRITKEVDRRFEEISHTTNLSKEMLIRVTRFCLTTGYFVFQGEVYSQLDGVAMGSPISPIIADIVMQRAIEKTLENSTMRIMFTKKYVDDLLLAVHRDDVGEVLQQFNSFHPKIQYTMEIEQNGSIPYLDMMVCRRPGETTLKTTWYSKTCASHRMLNYNSGHPKYMILNVARNFMNRVHTLTSEENNDNSRRIRSYLRLNHFPERIIRLLMNRNIATHPSSRRERESPTVFHSVTYIPGVSERIRRIVGETLGHGVAFRTMGKNRRFFTMVKDSVPLELRSNVVYCIPCGGCEKVYIGTTSQHLKNRMNQHRRDCRPPIKNDGVTALCNHRASTGHKFRFENVSIIDMHPHRGKREILETLHIQKNRENTVNKKGDVYISTIYANIISMQSRRGNDNDDNR